MTNAETPGAVFTKDLSQVSGSSWLYFCTKVKSKTWLRPFVNTAPELGGMNTEYDLVELKINS